VRDLSKGLSTRNLPFSTFSYPFLPIDVNDFFLIFYFCVSPGRKLLRNSGCNWKRAANPGNQVPTTGSGTYAVRSPSPSKNTRCKTSPSRACNRKLLSIWYATHFDQCLRGCGGLHGIFGRSFRQRKTLCNLQPENGRCNQVAGRAQSFSKVLFLRLIGARVLRHIRFGTVCEYITHPYNITTFATDKMPLIAMATYLRSSPFCPCQPRARALAIRFRRRQSSFQADRRVHCACLRRSGFLLCLR
jgi:hypothetical protein